MKTVQFTQSGLDYMAYVNGEYNHKDSLSGRYVRAEVAERLLTAAKLVVKISDRKHDAWDELKAAIRQAEEG